MRAAVAVSARAGVAVALFALAFAAAAAPPKKTPGPHWAELTADQQQVLGPLKQDWEKIEPDRRRKWMGIAKRYPAMKPEQQARVQRRMQAWAQLTPAQRDQARAKYRSLGTLEAKEKRDLRQLWAEYQALPPHERRMYDVPPSDTRASERKRRATPAQKAKSPSPLSYPSPM
jgi:hypothetical protein